MGGKASRDKGNRVERRIVNAFREAGIPARRVPLSGATEYAKGDVELLPRYYIVVQPDNCKDPFEGCPELIVRAEVKARKRFPAWIMEYLGSNDCLILVEDRQEPLVIVPMSKFMELIG